MDQRKRQNTLGD